MDWNLPNLTSKFTDVLNLLKKRDEDNAKMFSDSTATNLPNGTIRWNKNNARFEIFNGTSWEELADVYNMLVANSQNAQKLNNQNADYYSKKSDVDDKFSDVDDKFSDEINNTNNKFNQDVSAINSTISTNKTDINNLKNKDTDLQNEINNRALKDEAISKAQFEDKKNYNDEWEYLHIDLTALAIDKAYPLVWQFGNSTNQGTSEVMIKRHYRDNANGKKIYPEQPDNVHYPSLYFHVLGNDMIWRGDPHIDVIKYHDYIYVPTILRYDYEGFVEEEYKPGSIWRNPNLGHSPTHSMAYLRGGVSYRIYYKNMLTDPKIYTTRRLIDHSSQASGTLDYSQYVKPLDWVTSKAMPKINNYKRSKMVNLWTGRNIGGNVRLSESIQDFNFIIIIYDLSTDTLGWRESIWITKEQLESKQAIYEPGDSDTFALVNDYTIKYSRNQFNNVMLKILGVNL